MTDEEIRICHFLWSQFFPKDVFILQDNRLSLAGVLYDYFRSDEGLQRFPILANGSPAMSKSGNIVSLSVQELTEHLPFDDVESILTTSPQEVIACYSLAISRLANTWTPYADPPLVIHVSVHSLSTITPFSDIKSSTVGQLVCIEGHVVRVTCGSPLMIQGGFKCAKCQQTNMVYFEDGIYDVPPQCKTKKCYNKILDFDRSTMSTIPYQRIKVTELDEIHQPPSKRTSTNEQDKDDRQNAAALLDPESAAAASASSSGARAPRTLDVEIRGGLVNCCIAGDLVRIVGIVKTMQMEIPRSMRWGGGGPGGKNMIRESGLHQLYVLTNSIMCLKGSGDRATSSSTNLSTLNQLLGPVYSNRDSQKHSLYNSITMNRTSATMLLEFTKDELRMIRSIALSPYCVPLLIHSFCEGIFGHEIVKLGLLLGVFGGCDVGRGNHSNGGIHLVGGPPSHIPTSVNKEIQVRENIHVLVVGDPGLGKSQMLRAAATIAPRAVYVCGNTSTSAGLTVAISRDHAGQMNIEAGALVLADNGVCCIDELDKMQCDPHSLLEAMEQQSVSIAKSGMVTSLRSRAAVLAAANPVGGHYNKRKSVCENLKMNSALLSRFDLIFILLDEPDRDRDQMIGEHIMGFSGYAYRGDQQDPKRPRISQPTESTQMDSEDPDAGRTLAQRLRVKLKDLFALLSFNPRLKTLTSEQFRRYIEYAKTYVHPKMTKPAAKVLQKMYLQMRADSNNVASKNNLPVTTRHLESLIRLSQARARLELRDEVLESDAQDVVMLLQESLIDIFTAQNGEIIDCTKRGGQSAGKQIKALISVMNKEASNRQSKVFHRNDIETLALKLRLTKDLDELIELMKTEGYLLIKGPKLFQLQSV